MTVSDVHREGTGWQVNHGPGAGDSAPQRGFPEGPPLAIMGVTFDNVNLPEALRRIEQMIVRREPQYIVTANVDFLVQARRDSALRRILLDAHLVLCDGMPLVWMSRLLGNPLPGRVAGADLVPHLIRAAAKKKYRVFLLGATPEANARAVANVRAEFPGLSLQGHSPPFRPFTAGDNAEIAERIRAAQPDILLVSFGCPKAEKWMAGTFRSLGVPVTIGVGATIDFLAGRAKRAPLWMQRRGAEWLFRLAQEPRRLFRRYARDLWHFGRAMTAQLWRMKVAVRASRAGETCSLTALEPGCRHIRLPERFDASVVRRDRRVLENAAQGDCLLDLADTHIIDSTGVGELLQLRKRTQSHGSRLVLVAPSQAVQRTLELMGVRRYFLVAPSVIEARRLRDRQPREAGAGYELRLPGLSSGAAA